MKKLGCLIVSCVLIFTLATGCKANTNASQMPDMETITTTSEDYIPSETSIIKEETSEIPVKKFVEVTAENIATSAEAQALINEQEAYIDELTTILVSDKNFGLNISNPIAETVVNEIKNAQQRIDNYTIIFEDRQAQEIAAEEEARWEVRQNEYESATYIWRFFKNQGYSDHAVAGILGNLMAEVGGQTLYIQYWLSSSTYYGMCQWNREYYPGVIGQDLNGQCEFLLSTIEAEFNSYGYIVGYTYEQFINATDEQSAALAFAKVYERCGSGSYSVRQRNATTAYNYFVE